MSSARRAGVSWLVPLASCLYLFAVVVSDCQIQVATNTHVTSVLSLQIMSNLYCRYSLCQIYLCCCYSLCRICMVVLRPMSNLCCCFSLCQICVAPYSVCQIRVAATAYVKSVLLIQPMLSLCCCVSLCQICVAIAASVKSVLPLQSMYNLWCCYSLCQICVAAKAYVFGSVFCLSTSILEFAHLTCALAICAGIFAKRFDTQPKMWGDPTTPFLCNGGCR